MTAFGRSVVKTKSRSFSIEIQSVNSRFFVVQSVLPKEFFSYEFAIKKLLIEKVARGQLTVMIKIVQDDEKAWVLEKKKELKKNKQKWENLCQDLGYDKKCVDFAFLIDRSEDKGFFKEEKCWSYLEQGLLEALDALMVMKKQEGDKLLVDIKKRLSYIRELLEKVEKESKNQPQLLQAKLHEKLSKLISDDEVSKLDLTREIALLASKVDINEEIIRMHAHLDAFTAFIKEKESAGRKMEFLLQEMVREINTMASKAQNALISTLVVEIKSEIEKIKEQVQNIE